MDPRDELKELIAQAAEHLRACRELGLAHLGGGPVVVSSAAELPPSQLTDTTEKGDVMAKSPGKK